MYRNLKFLHMTDFFSTGLARRPATNIRYGSPVFQGTYDTIPVSNQIKLKHLMQRSLLLFNAIKIIESLKSEVFFVYGIIQVSHTN